MNHSIPRIADWDCYRFFLAVAETGSLSAASQVLAVSHPTVRRQIRDLENSLSTKLFSRTPDGYVLTETGSGLVDLAKTMEITAHAIQRCVNGEESACAGRVTIAAATGIGTAWLASKIVEFERIHPEIEIDLNISGHQLDLTRLEADIALRIGDPGAEDLIGRRVGKVSFGLYAARHYLEKNGTPQTVEDLQNHAIIESTGEMAGLTQVRQFREMTKGSVRAMSCNNLLTQFAAMRSGIGILPVPIYMADGNPDITRVLTSDFNVELDLWLLAHQDLIQTSRVRTVMDFLVQSIRTDTCFNETSKP